MLILQPRMPTEEEYCSWDVTPMAATEAASMARTKVQKAIIVVMNS